MAAEIHILNTDKIDRQTVLIEFSDNTYAIFTVEQLVTLAPERTSSNEED